MLECSWLYSRTRDTAGSVVEVSKRCSQTGRAFATRPKAGTTGI